MEPTNGNEVVSPSFSKNTATQKSGHKTNKRKKSTTSSLISIGTSTYERPATIHDKYAARPDSLEHICLAQFSIWYESVPKRSKINKTQTEIVSDHNIVCPHLETPMKMPKYIQLNDADLGWMALRKEAMVLEFHKFNEEKDAHAFFYSELVLFHHWRSEAELHYDDFAACLAKFKTCLPQNPEISFIETVKNQLFPEMNNVEMARAILEEYSDEQRPSHIGDFMDNQNEQDMAEQQLEGEHPDPDYEVRDYEGNFGVNNGEEASVFKMADFTRKEEMLMRARNLAPEQRLPFDQVMQKN